MERKDDMSSSIVGMVAGLLLAIATVVGGLTGLLLALVLGAIGYVVGGQLAGEVDLSQLVQGRRRG